MSYTGRFSTIMRYTFSLVSGNRVVLRGNGQALSYFTTDGSATKVQESISGESIESNTTNKFGCMKKSYVLIRLVRLIRDNKDLAQKIVIALIYDSYNSSINGEGEFMGRIENYNKILTDNQYQGVLNGEHLVNFVTNQNGYNNDKAYTRDRFNPRRPITQSLLDLLKNNVCTSGDILNVDIKSFNEQVITCILLKDANDENNVGVVNFLLENNLLKPIYAEAYLAFHGKLFSYIDTRFSALRKIKYSNNVFNCYDMKDDNREALRKFIDNQVPESFCHKAALAVIDFYFKNQFSNYCNFYNNQFIKNDIYLLVKNATDEWLLMVNHENQIVKMNLHLINYIHRDIKCIRKTNKADSFSLQALTGILNERLTIIKDPKYINYYSSIFSTNDTDTKYRHIITAIEFLKLTDQSETKIMNEVLSCIDDILKDETLYNNNFPDFAIMQQYIYKQSKKNYNEQHTTDKDLENLKFNRIKCFNDLVFYNMIQCIENIPDDSTKIMYYKRLHVLYDKFIQDYIFPINYYIELRDVDVAQQDLDNHLDRLTTMIIINALLCIKTYQDNGADIISDITAYFTDITQEKANQFQENGYPVTHHSFDYRRFILDNIRSSYKNLMLSHLKSGEILFSIGDNLSKVVTNDMTNIYNSHKYNDIINLDQLISFGFISSASVYFNCSNFEKLKLQMSAESRKITFANFLDEVMNKPPFDNIDAKAVTIAKKYVNKGLISDVNIACELLTQKFDYLAELMGLSQHIIVKALKDYANNVVRNALGMEHRQYSDSQSCDSENFDIKKRYLEEYRKARCRFQKPYTPPRSSDLERPKMFFMP